VKVDFQIESLVKRIERQYHVGRRAHGGEGGREEEEREELGGCILAMEEYSCPNHHVRWTTGGGKQESGGRLEGEGGREGGREEGREGGRERGGEGG
jgi:hypothetical protein